MISVTPENPHPPANQTLNHDATLDAAIGYTRRGWYVVPIPHRSKKITAKGWQRWRLDEADLPEHFGGRCNVGVLLGEPSGWLIDIDLDHPRAVELADQYLPPTQATFGRSGKPRSHRLYVAMAPVATKKHRSKSAGMIVESRSTGAQTVFPPSVHESGEAIVWEQNDPEPAAVNPDVLLDAVRQLADAVKIELGEKSAPRPRKLSLSAENDVGDAHVEPTRLSLSDEQCFDAALRVMLAMRIIDHHDGSARLFAAACRCVEHDLSDNDSLRCIRVYPCLMDRPAGSLMTAVRPRFDGAALDRRLAESLSHKRAEHPTTGFVTMTTIGG